jgi:hypothetical protein
MPFWIEDDKVGIEGKYFSKIKFFYGKPTVNIILKCEV